MLCIDRRVAFRAQRSHAKERGIPFELTYEEWIAWWGEDIHNRGRGDGKLCMCREGDIGPYALGNIHKLTNNQNSAEKFKNGKGNTKPEAVTEAQLKDILELLADNIPQRDIARIYETSQRTINRINRGTYRNGFKRQLSPKKHQE